MPDFDNGRSDDPEQYEARHGPSKRDRLRNDPAYGDWLHEQRKDREMMLDEHGNRSMFDDVDD